MIKSANSLIKIKLLIKNVLFFENATNSAFGVYIDSESEWVQDSKISECSFESNTSNSYGGIHIASSIGVFYIEDCNFENNTAALGIAITSEIKTYQEIHLNNL